MKLKYSLQIVALSLIASQFCTAGSIKGKVSPGASVVYLEGAAPQPVDKTVTMDQRGLMFQPHVLVIQV
ncbi:MAG: hypothetical protein ACXVKC_12015, partial [Candidatus Angelobacter sp.]